VTLRELLVQQRIDPVALLDAPLGGTQAGIEVAARWEWDVMHGSRVEVIITATEADGWRRS
jgi:hypothetical protein